MHLPNLPSARKLSFISFILFSFALLHGKEIHPDHEPLPQEKRTTVMIGGHEACASRILAKVRPEFDIAWMRQATRNTLQRGGLREARRYNIIRGLQAIEVNPTATNARMKDGRFTDAESLVAQIEDLQSTGMFEYVEPNWIVHLMNDPATSPFDPNDDAFVNGTLWGLRNTGQNNGTPGMDINVVPAWQITTGRPEVVVAVIDTGVRYDHQDLMENMWVNPGEIPGNGIDDNGSGYIDDVHGINAIDGSGDPMDFGGHGTHVAGTIAATANGGGPHVGVAPNIRIMALKFLGTFGGTIVDAITCIEYAINNGAHIMNNSWGGGGRSQALFNAILAANQAEILFVAAAGNSNNNNDINPTYPTNYNVPNVLSVAAINRDGNRAGFSNFGAAKVHIGAPGVSIFSSTANSTSSYANYNGTSMAAPHVAGIAALVLSEHPDADVLEVKNRILSTAKPVPALNGLVTTAGIADSLAALTLEEDGNMQVRAQPSGALLEGQPVTLSISVTDLVPVTDATVTASLQGGPPVTMRNDGVAPDTTANDQFYAGTFMVEAGTTVVSLEVQAEAPGRNPTTRTFEFNVVPRPTNDDFANRIVIPPGFNRVTGTNRLATAEPGEPLNEEFEGGSTVWWEWTPAEEGLATFDTFGSNFNTTLTIYRGTSLIDLEFLAANNDTVGRQSQVTINAEKEVVYQIQVDGYLAEQGDIVLNHPLAEGEVTVPVIVIQPINRNVLIGNPFALEVVAAGENLEYQWYFNDAEIPDAQNATYNVASAGLEEHTGNYRVVVSNPLGETTSNTVQVVVESVGLAPPNDDFENAQLLTSIIGLTTGSNVGATGEPGEPDHAGWSLPLSSVWYQWLAPIDGTFTVNTFGSDFDTTLAIYTGNSLATLVERGSNDDTQGLQSRVSIPVTGGTRYWIAVDGYSTSVGQIVLSYELSMGAKLANDLFENRRIIPPAGGVFTGTNVNARSEEPDEPINPPDAAPLNSVWWSWTAPETGMVSLSTAGSNYDTTLAVYTGSALQNLKLVKANDDYKGMGLLSMVNFMADAGVTYQIAVDGWKSSQGDITLNLSFTPFSGERGRVLLVEDQAGFGLARNSLLRSAFDVVSVTHEFTNNFITLKNTNYLKTFDLVVYGARGAGQGTLMPVAVKDSLENYIAGGGHLLVTGFNALGNPVDHNLAALVRASNPGKKSTNDPIWAIAKQDHPILHGMFGDYRGQIFAGTGYNDDILEPDTAAGAREMVSTGLPRETGKLIFTDLPGTGGSVGFWNGGLPGIFLNSQPDFSNIAGSQSIFLNYAAYATGTPGLIVEEADEPLLYGAAELDFGTVATDTSTSRMLRIRNVGTSHVGNLSVSIIGAGASNYTFSGPGTGSLAPGASANLMVSFNPTEEGTFQNSLRILSNDPARGTYDIALSGESATSGMELYMVAAAAAGLAGPDAAIDAAPFGGPSNLLKYAFNMDLSRADFTRMETGGTAGLPLLYSATREDGARHWVCEFVRRKGAGLIYTPKRSGSLLSGSFVPITGDTTVTEIDDTWERVILQGDHDLTDDQRDFAIMEVGFE